MEFTREELEICRRCVGVDTEDKSAAGHVLYRKLDTMIEDMGEMEDQQGFLPDDVLEELRAELQFFENLCVYKVQIETKLEMSIGFRLDVCDQIVYDYDDNTRVVDIFDIEKVIEENPEFQKRQENLQKRFDDLHNKVGKLSVKHNMSTNEIWALVE